MSITKISAADLPRKTRDFTSDENAYFDSLTDEDIEKAALADRDAQPSTLDMLRKGQANRRARAGRVLGAVLIAAEPGLDLPVWEITDQNGRKVLIKAVDIHKVVSSSSTATKVLTLEAVEASDVSGTGPERQTT